jgi:hypothetical protein
MKKSLLILSVIAFILSNCEDIEFFSEIPEVSFKEFRYADTTLVFEFIDGDGNMGLTQIDTTGPFHADSAYNKNLFITYFSYENEEFTEIEFKIEPHFRFEQIPTPEGNNKTVKGEMEIQMKDNFPIPSPDTFMIKFYIVDRDLHESNRDSSGLLTFNELLN